MTSPLPPLRRIVTGHNDAGPATVKYDDKATAKIVPHDAALRSLWITDSSPANLSSPGDNADAEVRIINNGSIFRIVDFPPRSSGHMHRTISIDYVIVQKAAVVLVLDDGSKTPVGEGDVVVQQGTMHGWDNHRLMGSLTGDFAFGRSARGCWKGTEDRCFVPGRVGSLTYTAS
ncbi:hypothetical protein FOPG_13572 [Fusarium oxysporum f. sp. conglutinans race 2 54008]|nr:hypothetical protein FOPG_13572 [Fusarium oxysporum f. sp. conglutinans race 2 54008]KAG6983609.1 hypothetical protein FocnCong_v007607 [Fusarium oxysporum f. sp. conglutinans]KAI8403887.1 hypothetical protein FOFC_15378 [Fusarium oxysporum]